MGGSTYPMCAGSAPVLVYMCRRPHPPALLSLPPAPPPHDVRPPDPPSRYLKSVRELNKRLQREQSAVVLPATLPRWTSFVQRQQQALSFSSCRKHWTQGAGHLPLTSQRMGEQACQLYPLPALPCIPLVRALSHGGPPFP